MESKLDQLCYKLDQTFKHTPGFKEWMAMQTRIAARDASVRLDVWNEWNDRRQEQPEAQTQPEPPEPEIIRGLRNREAPIQEQAYILTVLWNEAAGDGPLINPWGDVDERDDCDEQAELLCFRRESCDLNEDHFGLDPNSRVRKRKLWSPSPFNPRDMDELMGFVDQCLVSFKDGKTLAPRRQRRREWPTEPTDNYRHGPVEGLVKQFTEWLELSDEALYDNNGKGSYMVCKENRTSYRCWFKESKRYAEINAKSLAAKAGQSRSKPVKAGQSR
jgi:hypothetical protein